MLEAERLLLRKLPFRAAVQRSQLCPKLPFAQVVDCHVLAIEMSNLLRADVDFLNLRLHFSIIEKFATQLTE
jgi:hypothetical protein